MKKYYYLLGSERQGPFTLEELKAHNLTEDSLVWFHPMEDWAPAGQLDELKPLFGGQPTPPPATAPAAPAAPQYGNQNRSSGFGSTGSVPPKPQNYLVLAIICTALCCLPLGIAGIVNASNVDSRYNAGDYSGAERASKNARMYSIIGMVTSGVFLILYFIAIVFGVVAEGY